LYLGKVATYRQMDNKEIGNRPLMSSRQSLGVGA